jgi:hypothetical protein
MPPITVWPDSASVEKWKELSSAASLMSARSSLSCSLLDFGAMAISINDEMLLIF